MLKSYFNVAIRSLRRNKLLSFINVFGLGLSMSVGMMVMIRLQDQLSFDKFHPKPASTFRVLSDYRRKSGEHFKLASTPLPLLNKLQQSSAIEQAVSIYPALNGKATAGGKELNLHAAFTEPSFFKVFGFTLSTGNPDALQQPDAIFLNNTVAKNFFGSTNPLGKILRMESGKTFVVAGVLNQLPGKSAINFDAYASINAVTQLEKDHLLPEKLTDWNAMNAGYTFIVLQNGYSTSAVQKELGFLSAEINRDNKDGAVNFALQPLTKITPGTDTIYNEMTGGSSWSKFYFEIGVALIILIAASFNYTNLTVARALTRAKEVGVRKINGASRAQIFVQYIIEAIIISLISLAFAWVLLCYIIQTAPFNDGYEFIPSTFHYNVPLTLYSLAFALVAGLIAGAAPAWILSSFKPLRVLKNLKNARLFGRVSLQKTLIVFQYSLSLTIIIFLTAFYKQFAHLAAVDPGFKKDQVFVTSLGGTDDRIAIQKLLQIPGVKSATAMSGSFNKRFDGMNAPVWLNDKKQPLSLSYYYADPRFTRDMDLKLVAGRYFAANDAGPEKYILLNEQAVKALQIADNEKAVGQKLWINDSSQLEILGVLKDFHFENAGRPVRPLAIRSRSDAYQYLYLSVENGDAKSTAARIEQTMKDLSGSKQIEAGWLNEQMDKANSQTATISLLGYLAFMTIAIASLGLLGLVIYTVEVRRKEISIRKIIGAENKQLVSILSKGFIKLLFLSGLIAMPIGYVASFLFLQNFESRISFGLLSLLFSFAILLSIGLITIISQTYKAATQNPVTSLRTE